jgi:hypothetical protein
MPDIARCKPAWGHRLTQINSVASPTAVDNRLAIIEPIRNDCRRHLRLQCPDRLTAALIDIAESPA